MSATFTFGEDNGAQAGTPPRGTTRTFNVTNMNWKNIDDATTAYSSSVITAGNNSYPKYQWGHFSGTFNQISNVKFGHTTGLFGVGLALALVTGSGYSTPATTALSNSRDITQPSGLSAASFAINLGVNGPQEALASTLSQTGYTAYFATQLQTTVAASAGDTALVTGTISYDEQ